MTGFIPPGLLVELNTSVKPANATFYGFADPRTGGETSDHVIQLHHDVPADGVLD